MPNRILKYLTTTLGFLGAIKRSTLAWLGFTALGFLSMGALGFPLYYPAYPVLGLAHGNANDWRGDWVWPAMIAAGMLWPVFFLIAGATHLQLARRGWSKGANRLVYGLILWLGTVVVWWFLLATRHQI